MHCYDNITTLPIHFWVWVVCLGYSGVTSQGAQKKLKS